MTEQTSSLLSDLGALADHLSPSDLPGSVDRVVGALIKVLEHQGLEVPAVTELLPWDHPSQIQPPAPAAPAPQQDVSGIHGLLSQIADRLDRLEGHQTSDPAGGTPAGSTGAPSEPAGTPPDEGQP